MCVPCTIYEHKNRLGIPLKAYSKRYSAKHWLVEKDSNKIASWNHLQYPSNSNKSHCNLEEATRSEIYVFTFNSKLASTPMKINL